MITEQTHWIETEYSCDVNTNAETFILRGISIANDTNVKIKRWFENGLIHWKIEYIEEKRIETNAQ